LDDLA